VFTGIVEAMGQVSARQGRRLEVRCDLGGLAPGDSIAVNGVCLTVTALGEGAFTAELSEETLARTSLGGLGAGARVNLERPLAAGGRLGGHIVQGHADGTAVVARVEPRAGSVELWFEPPAALARYLVEKGSVALDGISLTVARLGSGTDAGRFSVAAIPHTLAVTTLGDRRPGDIVNVEVDILAKYVESLLKGGT
jgi:riboflavin synthase